MILLFVEHDFGYILRGYYLLLLLALIIIISSIYSFKPIVKLKLKLIRQYAIAIPKVRMSSLDESPSF
ncbi:hypothetical protein Mic7113_0420 [Allocoleopsis franciscana PCC 7113]|uniref:Uncharacterized protein n=1 Tax=Allocoleopsis franciscana PCC 7113 TaxID=1173027 RepID=K9W7H8_9CYAN|nr:hypothetical protein Mic7113_0420 [Allocoleopsis franciscana PCC 7113]